MPLRNAESAKDTYSSTASTIVRQLALGGIALVWIIKVGKPEAGGIRWSTDLMFPLAMFTLSLTSDLLQYVWGTIAWSIFFSNAEAKGKGLDDLVSPSARINTVTLIFFVAKIAAVLAGYFTLLFYMFEALRR
jgi:hypothetical protein